MFDLQFPDNWFEEETREGYTISKKMKWVWAYELDMLYQVQKICDKYNIKWFVDGGTLLGAVRHKGFIPWDDDIDIFMSREDYDKFIKVAESELDDRYFLQNDLNNRVFYCHSKLRRNNTTAILDNDVLANFDFHQGIFIDIFPFDNVPTDERSYKSFMEYLILVKKQILITRSIWWKYKKDDKSSYKLCEMFREDYEKNRQIYNQDECIWSANLGLPSLHRNVKKRKSEYESSIMMDFEMLKVPVPIGYESILTRLYGDYMKPVRGASCHGEIFFDPFHDYTYYLNLN